MKLMSVFFALLLVLATASQALACGAGGGDHKDGDKVESMES